mgnify:CR=1 FL=1
MQRKTLRVNGVVRSMIVNPEQTLADVLRRQLLLTGCKVGCGQGQCGSCSVILDGRLVRSCIVKMKTVADDAEILTIEGIGTADNLHPLQVAWMVHGAAQCGFCTTGFIMSAKALLDKNDQPTREEIREAIAGNICRCTGYVKIEKAVSAAAEKIREGK